jgi:hypothetical protein
LGLAVLVLALSVSGCFLVRTPVKQTQNLFRSVEGTVGLNRQPTNLLTYVQREVMREADNYSTVVAQAADDLAAKAGTPEARIDALQWKLQQATAAYMNATGENPALNAVDMVVLASLSSDVVASYWVGEKYHAAAEPLLEAHRRLATNAWLVLNQVLNPGQQLELRKLIEDWIQKNPNQHYVAAIRLQEFVGVLGKNQIETQGRQPNSILNLLNVDPLSGLDPAVRAVEETRLTAERIMYYAERAPMLLSWQVELMTFRISDQPASQQLLSNVNSLSQSAAIFAQTARELPSVVDRQREAAINQFFAGVAIERSNILVSLDSQETKLRELLPEVRQTLATAGTMANSLDGAIKSLDAFVRYVSPPDTNPLTTSTNSQPFNVLDYGKAAGEIAAMARDLGGLIASANQSATQLVVVSEQATRKAERLVDRAFWLALVLVVVVLAGSVAARLAYRALAGRAGGKTVESRE